jgi:hypothetical protein
VDQRVVISFVTIAAAAPYLISMTKRLLLPLLAALAGSALFASVAAASCIPMSAQQQRERASVIFDGVALEGATGTGVQRFRVIRYLEGQGPRVVRVDTGFIRHADGSGTVTSVSLDVRRGEHWRIFGRGSARKVLVTNVCDGSGKR